MPQVDDTIKYKMKMKNINLVFYKLKVFRHAFELMIINIYHHKFESTN